MGFKKSFSAPFENQQSAFAESSLFMTLGARYLSVSQDDAADFLEQIWDHYSPIGPILQVR